MAELAAGVSLPSGGKKPIPYRVGIRIGENMYESEKPKELFDGYCRWSSRLKGNSESGGFRFKSPAEDISQLGQVFVYLIDERDR